MVKATRDKAGKFTGSIGLGKTQVPTSSPAKNFYSPRPSIPASEWLLGQGRGGLGKDDVWPSGTTRPRTSGAGEALRAEAREARMCVSRIHENEDDIPWASVRATIVDPSAATFEHPRGTWTSGVPLCSACAQRIEKGLPFGYFVIEQNYPQICDECFCFMDIPNPNSSLCQDCLGNSDI